MESFDVTIDLTELAEAAVHPLLCSRERVRNAVEQSGQSAGSVLRSGVCGDHLPHRPDVLRAVVPEPPEVVGDALDNEFIRMPDPTGFGEYTADGGRVIQGVNR